MDAGGIRVELRVLGPIELAAGSRLIDLGTRMHRAVLSILVMEADRVVSLDRLIDNLWGDDPPQTATKALQVYISGLRKALDPNRPPGVPSGILVTQPPGYVLRVPPGVIDANRFEMLADEGQALLAAGRPDAACDALDRSLRLWRGPAYEDVAFESFLQTEIARLNELRAGAAEARVEAVLALGRHAEAVVDVDRMVVEEPLRERRWELLALALYRGGRQGDALRVLNRARRTLGEELGLEPGPDLRRLERDILAQSPALDWRPPPENTSSAIRRVPAGRATELILSLAPDAPPTAPERSSTAAVLPPGECPHGFSLADMAAAIAPFTMSGNDPTEYPDTPFQILHVASFDLQMIAGGTLATGTQLFTVPAGTQFYLPIFSVTDVPPVVGVFPATAAEAVPYFFDPAHHGGRDFEVVVDGTPTAIGSEYLAGAPARPR